MSHVARDASEAAAAPHDAPLVLLDERTGHAGARSASGACYTRGAPEWLRAAVGGERAIALDLSRGVKFFRAHDAPYAVQLAVLCAGAAAYFSLTGRAPPAAVVRLPLRQANNCFANAALQCLVRVSSPALWAAGPAEAGAATSDLPAGLEALAKDHLREALRSFSARQDATLVAAVKHLVGRVLVRAADKAQDFDDGAQHDSSEFVLRLLSSGLDASPAPVPSARADALRWDVPRGDFQFEELPRGAAPPPRAAAVVSHTGGAASGHYVAYIRHGGGWRAVGDLTSSEPRNNVKLAFYCTSLAPKFLE